MPPRIQTDDQDEPFSGVSMTLDRIISGYAAHFRALFCTILDEVF